MEHSTALAVQLQPALATRRKDPLDGLTFPEVLNYCDMMVRTGFLPESITTKEKAMAVYTFGQELGIGFWEAMTGIDIIFGRPTPRAQLQLALIERSGLLEAQRVEWGTDEGGSCTVHMKRVGRDPVWAKSSVAMAKQSGQWDKPKSLWPKFTQRMLWNAATGDCATMAFADVVRGDYSQAQTAVNAAATPAVEERPSWVPTATVATGEVPTSHSVQSQAPPAEDPPPVRMWKRWLEELAKPGLATKADLEALAAAAWGCGLDGLKNLDDDQLDEWSEVIEYVKNKQFTVAGYIDLIRAEAAAEKRKGEAEEASFSVQSGSTASAAPAPTPSPATQTATMPPAAVTGASAAPTPAAQTIPAAQTAAAAPSVSASSPPSVAAGADPNGPAVASGSSTPSTASTTPAPAASANVSGTPAHIAAAQDIFPSSTVTGQTEMIPGPTPQEILEAESARNVAAVGAPSEPPTRRRRSGVRGAV